MAYPRLKHEEGSAGFYHCMSRCVGGSPLLAEEEKEYLRRGIWKVARFCGLRVITYCVMSNHFHVLVEVPKEDPQEISDAELIERIAALHGRGQARLVEKLLAEDRQQGKQQQQEGQEPVGEGQGQGQGQGGRAAEGGGETSAEELRRTYLKRMGNLSVFMQEIKQRFSRWYNRRHDRFGTVWAERFKSLLVEASSPCLSAVAAYIDLNGVRAGLVEDPKDYRWCGYAEALAGEKRARRGLGLAMEPDKEGAAGHWRSVGVSYRKLMMAERAPVPGRSGVLDQKQRLEVERERAREVIAMGGRLPLAELLRLRVRYFSDGLLLGGREYAERVFTLNRTMFGVKRRSGARAVRGMPAEGGFYALRDLKVRVFG